jgi:hypothetical protein
MAQRFTPIYFPVGKVTASRRPYWQRDPATKDYFAGRVDRCADSLRNYRREIMHSEGPIVASDFSDGLVDALCPGGALPQLRMLDDLRAILRHAFPDAQVKCEEVPFYGQQRIARLQCFVTDTSR